MGESGNEYFQFTNPHIKRQVGDKGGQLINFIMFWEFSKMRKEQNPIRRIISEKALTFSEMRKLNALFSKKRDQ